tara:strand:+ start:260 stop:382 length:123 start_codon:yes stop_codon:yes gene_type:complete
MLIRRAGVHATTYPRTNSIGQIFGGAEVVEILKALLQRVS